jgi:hypothetical protein
MINMRILYICGRQTSSSAVRLDTGRPGGLPSTGLGLYFDWRFYVP